MPLPSDSQKVVSQLISALCVIGQSSLDRHLHRKLVELAQKVCVLSMFISVIVSGVYRLRGLCPFYTKEVPVVFFAIRAGTIWSAADTIHIRYGSCQYNMYLI